MTRTLDEVIDCAEKWTENFDEGSLEKKMLFYLKMYRSDSRQWEADRKAYEDNRKQKLAECEAARDKYIARLKELEIGTLNNPLTWDELKTMVGKPVWVEALLYKQWAIIAYVGDEHLRFEGVSLYAPESRVYMGEDDGWQAYRKERGELTHCILY